MATAKSLKEQISVTEVSTDKYVSVANPARMGNVKAIAYGGCALGGAIQAAGQTVKPNYVIYSAMGNYLGPSSTERKLIFTVTRLRDTRTFATRFVQVSQEMDDGSVRMCLTMLADFQVKEQASLLTYTSPPSKKYSSVGKSFTYKEKALELLEKKQIPEKIVTILDQQFGVMDQFTDTRAAPEGLISHNVVGIAKHIKTPQEDVPPALRTSADYFKSRHPFDSSLEHFSALGFVLDGYLSFLPLSQNHLFMDDASACSSLDFALRFFTTEIDITKWHFKELRTVTAAEGRTYSETRLWDENENMVASMTQQCILRPSKKHSKI